MRTGAIALVLALALAPVGQASAQALARLGVTPQAVVLGSTLHVPPADTTKQDGHPVRWGRVGLGALFGALAGGALGLWIHSIEDVGESSPAEVVGLAAFGAIVGAFVGLATGK